MENPILLMILFLAIAVMAGYYYVQRAKRRDASDAAGKDQPTA